MNATDYGHNDLMNPSFELPVNVITSNTIMILCMFRYYKNVDMLVKSNRVPVIHGKETSNQQFYSFISYYPRYRSNMNNSHPVGTSVQIK